MIAIAKSWKNLSISKKLYLVVGVMACLIIGELLTLRFAMKQLSAARALVGGESMWSKGQKDAVFSLQRYRITRREKDYEDFISYLEIPAGDHIARIELLKPHFDEQVVTAGFVQGHIKAEDVPAVIELLRRFYWTSYLSKAIQIWTDGDVLMGQLREEGTRYHAALVSYDFKKAEPIFDHIRSLNEQLTTLEENFSNTLGAGSRWLENVVLFLLTLAVLMVESVGLTLAIFTNRSISKRLAELQNVAEEIGRGSFDRRVNVDSTDEIGKVSESVNQMGVLLRESYTGLEKKVAEQTAEAREAVQMRDEFLSVASHELRTPLTSLSLELQLLKRSVQKLENSAEKEKSVELAEKTQKGVLRLTLLLDELLDLTRIRVGKFEVNRTRGDLVPVVHEVVSRLSPEATQKGAPITIDAPSPVITSFDSLRIEQVVTNLISNAIKYGNGSPIEISIQRKDGKCRMMVTDQGPGIPKELQEKLFHRFERAEADPSISGLGLGLYITLQIVNAHDGKIWVESEVGKGSRFILELD